jgi:hypothetical protein
MSQWSHIVRFLVVPSTQVRVETLAAAVVAGLEDDTLSGVQRFSEMESLEKALKSS